MTQVVESQPFVRAFGAAGVTHDVVRLRAEIVECSELKNPEAALFLRLSKDKTLAATAMRMLIAAYGSVPRVSPSPTREELRARKTRIEATAQAQASRIAAVVVNRALDRYRLRDGRLLRDMPYYEARAMIDANEREAGVIERETTVLRELLCRIGTVTLDNALIGGLVNADQFDAVLAAACQ